MKGAMKGAKRIIAALEEAGCDAYMVGGSVRDKLLGRACHDIDITTSAGTYEIECVAKAHGWGCKGVGRAFGCMVVLVGKHAYEVTSFRGEVYAGDGHRPTQVIYGVSLEEDVKRRDFTINGMVMTAEGEVIDLVGGQADLAARVIRCIGDGRERFAEDALRAFRACRFAAQLDFDLDEEIVPAIRENLHRVSGLSLNRVRTELEKTLLADNSSRGLAMMMACGLLDASAKLRMKKREEAVPILPELHHLVGLEQNTKYHAHDAWGHTLAVVDALPQDLVVRWAGLLHDVAKGLDGIRGEKNGQPTDYGHAERGAEIARKILIRLGYSGAMAKQVAWLVREHMGMAPDAGKKTVRWLRARADGFKNKSELLEGLGRLQALLRADDIGTGREHEVGRDTLFAEVVRVAKETPLYTGELAITGKDLVPIVGEGVAIREQMERLLTRVITGELANEKDELLAATEKYVERKKQEKQKEQEEPKECLQAGEGDCGENAS